MRANRSTIVVVLLLLPLAPLGAGAADDREIFLSALPGMDLDAPGDLAGAAPRGAGEVLSVLAGVEALPVPCGTPLVRNLAPGVSPILDQVRLAVIRRPALDPERVALTPDGAFALHYPGAPRSSGLLSVDRDRNGNPDLVDRIVEALLASRSLLVTRLGYPAPLPEG